MAVTVITGADRLDEVAGGIKFLWDFGASREARPGW
jgi:hypothetical protein